MRERRSVMSSECRVDLVQPGMFEAVVVRYNVVDDYNTRFRPGVFAASLAARLPRITWGHDWRDVIGRWVDYRDTPSELTLIGQLDDMDAVPRARQAYAQLKSGTIDQFSVGFTREADELVDPSVVDGQRGVTDITKAQLDEAALVLLGAVPGTRLISVRSGDMVPAAVAADLLAQLGAGNIDLHEALGRAKDAAMPLPGDDEPDGDDDEQESLEEKESELAEEFDATLAAAETLAARGCHPAAR